MGTGSDDCPEELQGIIPRAVNSLFAEIDARRETAFKVSLQFVEIYNDFFIDLLDDKRSHDKSIKIREKSKNDVYLQGVQRVVAKSAREALDCLRKGSSNRKTGSTLMNSQSSRSHAIFTIFVHQTRSETQQAELINLEVKFNFVDLAGSERLSRSGAVGERARETKSINSDLLFLGNVIEALGKRKSKKTLISYRDCNLTRILQDSLGGNSVTTMIACISPLDRDFTESLNTLRYVNRAKNIKNKVVANKNSQNQIIKDLKFRVVQLEKELEDVRQGKTFQNGNSEEETAWTINRLFSQSIKILRNNGADSNSSVKARNKWMNLDEKLARIVNTELAKGKR